MDTDKKLAKIAIAIPCYNEALALPVTLPRILEELNRLVASGKIDANSYVLCCDDGSNDDTWPIIQQMHSRDSRIRGISLAHNVGHQYALMAALMEVRNDCDAAISMDADLQDDPAVIGAMVEKYYAGCNIVYGVRSVRNSDQAMKRWSARAFYKLQKSMGIDTVYDHADFRLMDAKALEILAQYPERNLYLRGIVPQIGLKSAQVEYVRQKRAAGKSKYTLKKMASLSVDGIASFSISPMKAIFSIGLIFLLLDIITWIYVMISYFQGKTIAGWTSLMLSVWFIGSLILIALGIIGIYIGKIYIEAKRRPRYFISHRV